MKYLDIDNVEAGMFFGEDIYDEGGLLLYSKNTLISEEVLNRIRRIDLDLVMILGEDEIVIIEDDQKDEIIKILQETISNLKFYGKDYFSDVKDICLNAVEKIKKEDLALRVLYDLKEIDEYSIMHAIRVGVLSAFISAKQDQEEEFISKAFIAGIFHQAGKLKISKDLLLKAEELSEKELNTVRSYINYTDDVLKNIDLIGAEISVGICQSTERLDGSGYPDGIKGNITHPIAKIVAVANVFDAAVNDKCYKKAVSLFKISQELFESSLDKLSPKATTPLIHAVESTYVGTKVELSDGRIGEIIFMNKYDAKKPLVKVNDEIIDLFMGEEKLSIVKMFRN